MFWPESPRLHGQVGRSRWLEHLARLLLGARDVAVVLAEQVGWTIPKTMTLITSDCGATCSLGTRWP